MVKIAYASDLHLEMKSLDVIPKLFKNTDADVLILAGDICAIGDDTDWHKFTALIKYYSPKYKYIIMVAGNHEPYVQIKKPGKNNCMDAVNRRLKSVTKTFPNYIYLNCDTITLTFDKKPYMFIGATLWTKVEKKNQLEIEQIMNDYLCIYTCKDGKIAKFTMADMQKLHMKHITFIKKAVLDAELKKIPAVLITHHKPITDTPDNEQTITTQAYECDLSKILHNPVRLAIFGHTHQSCLKTINGILYLSNPVGYPGQRTLYKPALVIEV